jgi:hypothetical protein
MLQKFPEDLRRPLVKKTLAKSCMQVADLLTYPILILCIIRSPSIESYDYVSRYSLIRCPHWYNEHRFTRVSEATFLDVSEKGAW